MKKIFPFLFFMLMLFSCGSDDSNFEDISSQLISRGNLGLNNNGFLPQQMIEINSETQWTTFINAFNALEPGLIPSTNVDFETETVIAVVDESRENGDFAINLTPTSNGDVILIQVEIVSQADDTIDGSTQPFHIISIDNPFDLPVEFEEL